MVKTLLFSILLFFVAPAQAAVVVSSSEKTVTLDQVGPEIKEGEAYFAVDTAGKRRALLTITEVKGSKATGELVKGLVSPGLTLVKKEKPPSKIGFRLAAGFSAFSALLEDATAKNRTGLTGAAFVSWIPSAISFETGLIYYQAGYRYVEEEIVDLMTELEYVGVPFWVKYSLGDNPPVGMNLKLGMMASQLIKGKTKGVLFSKEVEQGAESSRQDYLILGGLDYQWDHYFVDISYAHGLKVLPGNTGSDFTNTGYFILFGWAI